MGFPSVRSSVLFIAAGLLVAACGSPEVEAPDVDDLSPLERASMEETEGLLIYGNIAEYNWRYVIDKFEDRYPWIHIEVSDIGPSVSFERYYSEVSVGKHSADIIASAAPDAWHRFYEKGEVMDYSSTQVDALPDWSMPNPGVYTISTDPLVIAYNKVLVPEDEAPHSLADLAQLASENPDQYLDKMTTYNATSHSFAYDAHWAVMRQLGDIAGRQFFDAVGSVTRAESGGANMVEKLTSGEYSIGYFVSGITIFPRMSQAGRSKILGWSFIEDGTPLFHRNIAITKNTHSPNSAKLLLDFVLSHEGQIAVGEGGLTPFRPDVTADEVPYVTYRSIEETIGADNVIHVDYDPSSEENRDTFLDYWAGAFRQTR